MIKLYTKMFEEIFNKTSQLLPFKDNINKVIIIITCVIIIGIIVRILIVKKISKKSTKCKLCEDMKKEIRKN